MKGQKQGQQLKSVAKVVNAPEVTFYPDLRLNYFLDSWMSPKLGHIGSKTRSRIEISKVTTLTQSSRDLARMFVLYL